jgi:hypothetical protein
MSEFKCKAEEIYSCGGSSHFAHFGPGAVKGEVSRHYSADGTHEECCTAYVVGVPLLRRFETAVRSWAGAKGLNSIMLFGTPLEAQSAAATPLI